ncbi:Translocation protein in type III secretion [gamma proteobacterium HdN1]|nr:Translocation protein in type III secretion [gamma proteobacterium HdN1]
MAEKQSDQTELPTPKRIEDARRDGNVSRSQDLGKTLLIPVWIGLLGGLLPVLFQRWIHYVRTTWQNLPPDNLNGLLDAMMSGAGVFLAILLPLIFFAAAIGVFIEFVQVGKVLALKPVKPDLNRLNPAAGLKRMFSQRNFVELAKSVGKSSLIILLSMIVLRDQLGDTLKLPYGSHETLFAVLWLTLRAMLISVTIAFLLIAAMDVAYQKYAWTKDLMMSRRDIQQEHKNSEGDPMLKGQRRALHQEWSQENAMGSVRGASVVVTNPTHYAVAIHYEKGKTDLPLVVAKGEDYFARMIREAAQEAGVPIMENVDLARALYRDIDVHNPITSEFFEAVAQLLHWAESVRQEEQANDFLR